MHLQHITPFILYKKLKDRMGIKSFDAKKKNAIFFEIHS